MRMMLNKFGHVLMFMWVLLACLVPAGVVHAGDEVPRDNIPKTGDKAWDTLSQVKKDWMLKLYDIVVEDRPELKPIANESLKWRMKEMEYDTKKFQYMSKNHPELIIRDKGLGAFANLDWFPEFSKDLASKDPAFAKLEKTVKQLKKDISNKENWKKLESFIQNLSKNEKYKEKLKKFTSELAKVQKILTLHELEMSRSNQ